MTMAKVLVLGVSLQFAEIASAVSMTTSNSQMNQQGLESQIKSANMLDSAGYNNLKIPNSII